MPIYYNEDIGYWIPENIGVDEDYQIVKVFPYITTDITWGVEIKKKLIEDDPELKDAFI